MLNLLGSRRIYGDILDIKDGIIVQQVNCQGVMGAGLALGIKTLYPEVYTRYKDICNKIPKDKLLGASFHIDVTDKLTIFNLFSQFNYGRDYKVVYTDYEAFTKCIRRLRRYALDTNKDVYIPYKIGCGLANGNWDKIQLIIKEELHDVKYYIVKKEDK